ILKIEIAVAAPTSPLPTLSSLRPPLSSIPAPGSDGIADCQTPSPRGTELLHGSFHSGDANSPHRVPQSDRKSQLFSRQKRCHASLSFPRLSTLGRVWCYQEHQNEIHRSYPFTSSAWRMAAGSGSNSGSRSGKNGFMSVLSCRCSACAVSSARGREAKAKVMASGDAAAAGSDIAQLRDPFGNRLG
ncbi:hypothetical protein BGW80DRAFT_1267292, partial [Lactifluus volemus]